MTTFLLSFLIYLLSPSFTGSAEAIVADAAVEMEMSGPDIVLSLKPPLISGNSIKLGYVIPYPGYIEFHLFNSEGEKIWQNFGVKDKGEHYQALRRDKMDPGATYTYQFWYKGKPYPGKFTNN